VSSKLNNSPPLKRLYSSDRCHMGKKNTSDQQLMISFWKLFSSLKLGLASE